MLAGTLQQLWPIITVGPDTNKKNNKKKKYQKTQRYKKNYRYIQQVIKRDKGQALLYFIQTWMNVGLHNHRKQLTWTYNN